MEGVNLFGRMKLTGKTVLAVVLVGLLPLAAASYMNGSSARSALIDASRNQLSSLGTVKKNQIEAYFTQIRNQSTTFAENHMVVDAMREFKQAFKALPKELGVNAQTLDRYRRDVSAYYSGHFAREFEAQNGTAVDVAALLPGDPASLASQYLYIADNPNPLGEKDSLDAAADSSAYSKLHRHYHPVFRSYLKKFGFYDIFLVDPDSGNIVYSVFKEIDYGTSLESGPYAGTNFARAFKAALRGKPGEATTLVDFEPYRPSYDGAASFIATPVYDGNRLEGVLVFQMPVGEINGIMQERSGLGENGETYLVGSDKLMRSQSSLSVENTILATRVDTIATKEIFAGESGVALIDDYAGNADISYFTPLDIDGVDWGLVAEIDQGEALGAVNTLIVGALAVAGVAFVALLVVAFLFARTLIRPIGGAVGLAQQIASGDLSGVVEVSSNDEIGELLTALGSMQGELRNRIESDAEKAATTGRLKQALDSVSANVMVADANFDIIYLNGTVREMFESAESDIRQDLPCFDAGKLMGTNITDFHKNPAHQRLLLADLSGTFESELTLGGRTFKIVANPIVIEGGERVGTVVEWEDLTERLAGEEQDRQRAESERLIAAENGRIRQALDNVSGNVMIGDNDLNIVYVNEAVTELFKDAEADVRQELPDFDANGLIGSCIDMFHKDPSHQRNLFNDLTGEHRAELTLGNRTMRVVANPVFGNDGDRLGTVVEWTDRSQELAIEAEVQHVVDSALDGDLANRIDLEGKTGFFTTLSQAVNELVGVAERVIDDTTRVLSAMSDGNLTETIEGDFKGSFGKLKDDANATVAKLTEVVGNIQTSSQSVKTGADEISQGNTNLSQRTEEQASSLEETASSMEEMTSTVKQNADNAGEANQLAMAAREEAEKGGTVVRQAVSAMGEINESSKKISDIIGVIDEIAFQTNLLALNASVEAARAGDQGRGFAVVASEVRNLAGRSATAAKEIKDLIEDSGRKVDEGSRLVNESGESLEEIVNGVKKVTDIVGEIAAASQEQSAGIEQVNKAVVQLDELTQQNAALVEEAAAASESMGEQAVDLSNMMSFFTVDACAASTAEPGVERRSAERPWTGPAAEAEVPSAPRHAAAGGGDQEWEEF